MHRWIETRNASWTPAAVDADETVPVFHLEPGDLVLGLLVKPTVAAAEDTNSSVIIGDGVDDNGFLTTLDLETMTVGTWISGRGDYLQGGRYYTESDTIDLEYTDNTTPGETLPALDLQLILVKLG